MVPHAKPAQTPEPSAGPGPGGRLPPASVFADGADVTIDEATFPDAALRAWLLDPAHLNGAGSDHLLSRDELAGITELDLSGLGIADLTGIGHFAALETLNVSNNVLTSLDLSGNPALVQLYCRHNLLETLDVSHNLELVFIETFDNRLTSFDGSMLKKLEFLHIDYNRLTTLDMSANPALKGNGFVAANNQLDTLTLPDIPDFTVEAEVFYEQNPRTGYDVVQWYRDPGYTDPVSPTDLLPANGQTLYARWVPNAYTVYHRPNGGQGSMDAQTAAYDVDFELTPNAFTRTGYTFTGWNTNSDASGRPYADRATVRNLSGQNSSRTAVYLYAQWQANPYTIRYDANGGQGSLPDTAAVYGTSLSLPDSAFTNSEGVFLGWSRTPDAKQPEFFAGQSVRDLSAEAGAVVTLYAVWMSNQEIQQGYQDQLNAPVRPV